MPNLSPHLLILEDNADQELLIERAVTANPISAHWTISSCVNLLQARALISAQTFDVVLADLKLPDGSVSELLASLPEKRPYPVVVMTAQGDESQAVEVMRAGASDYLCKSAAMFESIPNVLSRVMAEWKQRIERWKAETALRESETRLHAFFDNASDLIQGCDPEGQIIFTNRAWRNTMGYSEKEVFKLRIFDLIHPDSLKHCQDIFVRLMAGEPVGLIEFSLRSKSGQRVDLEGSVNVRFTNGEPVNSQGIFRNVTKTKATERALKAEQERARLYLDTVQTIVLSVDPLGVITSINRKGCERLGYLHQPEALIGQNFFQRCLSRPEDIQVAQPIFQALLSGHSEESKSCETRVLCRNGSTRIIAWHSTALHSDSNEIVGILYSGEDITDRKHAEDELRRANEQLEQAVSQRTHALQQTEDRFRAIFYHSVDGIALFEEDRVTMANPAFLRMLGRDEASPVEGLECVLSEAIEDEAQRTHLFENLRQAASSHTTTEHYEIIVHESQRNRLMIETFSSPINLNDANNVLLLCRDITKRKDAEKRLARSQRMESIGTIAGGMAHDLNNIFTPILIAFDELGDEVKSANGVELLDSIKRSAERGASMIKQLLTFAKGSRGEKCPINLGHLLDELESLISRTFGKSIHIEMSIRPDLPAVMANSTELHQALLNICVNARDAMPEGGQITIEATRIKTTRPIETISDDMPPGTYACLILIDTGKGIPPKILNRIFEPFFSTKSQEKGTGFGLATVLGIVEGHKGYLRVGSKLGVGTRFEIYLPISLEAVKEASQKPEPHLSDAHGIQFLIVDDEAPIRRLIARVLKKLNIAVLLAGNGEEAIAQIERHGDSIKGIITDLDMPGMNGLTLLEKLHARHGHFKTIVITGAGDYQALRNTDSCEISKVLMKPFSTYDLKAAVSEVICQE